MSLDEIAAKAAEDIFGIFGVSATYAPPSGSPVNVTAIVDKDMEHFPGMFASRVNERRTAISLRAMEVANPINGATITWDGESYKVISEISNDGIVIRCSVTRQA